MNAGSWSPSSTITRIMPMSSATSLPGAVLDEQVGVLRELDLARVGHDQLAALADRPHDLQRR